MEALIEKPSRQLPTLSPRRTKSGVRSYKLHGITAVAQPGREAIQRAINELAQYGVFIVEEGELESWLTAIGVAHDPKHDWLARAFTRLGSDPSASTYVAVGGGGVWDFVESVGRWIANPQRRGMP